MKIRKFGQLMTIISLILLVGCNSGNTSRHEEPNQETSQETNQISQDKSQEESPYAFLNYDARFPYGAVFKTNAETILNSINSNSLFHRNITIEDMTFTEMNDGSNTIRYAYSESGYDTLELYVDKETGYIICGSWIADLNYYNFKYDTTMYDIYSKASIVLSSITKSENTLLSSKYYHNLIEKNIENSFSRDGKGKRISYQDGVALSFVTTDAKRLYIRITAINESNYDSWSNEAMLITEPTAPTEDIKPLLLNELNTAERLLNEKRQIFKYTVKFDNQIFRMTAGNTKIGDYSIAGAEPIYPNILMREVYDQTDEGIIYSIYLYVIEDYYFIDSHQTPLEEIILTFQCETEKLYQYDLENNQELHTFVYGIIDCFAKAYPLADEKIPCTLADLSHFEFLFYCLSAKTEFSDGHRIILDDEMFRLGIFGDIPDTGTQKDFIDPYFYHIIYSEKDIIVMCHKDCVSANRSQIHIYQVVGEWGNDGYLTFNYCLVLSLECLSDPSHNKSLNECPDYMNFVKEVAKALAN